MGRGRVGVGVTFGCSPEICVSELNMNCGPRTVSLKPCEAGPGREGSVLGVNPTGLMLYSH